MYISNRNSGKSSRPKASIPSDMFDGSQSEHQIQTFS